MTNNREHTHTSTSSRLLDTAVLFLVFNRPETTRQVFEAIRQAKPPRLYVSADGPRAGKVGEAERCNEVRKIATTIDWPCEVRTLFRKENLGCKRAVSGGITWFFEYEEQGIVLEDDCLPHPDFFRFCEELLVRYADDDRVWVITGDNFQNGIRRGDASYYFSRYNHVWGWASWRRAWKKADMAIQFWSEWKRSATWEGLWPDSVARRYWEKIFDRMYRAEIDTWDYPWTASVWYHGGLTATPNVNLVSNIGFGQDSTHTASVDSPYAEMLTEELGVIRHPSIVTQDLAADWYVFEYKFGGRDMRFPRIFVWYSLRLIGKLIRELKKFGIKLVSLFSAMRDKEFFLLFRKIVKRVRNLGLLSAIKKRKVLSHKRMLTIEGEKFSSYRDVLFVFQTFNKASNIEKILRPFLSLSSANIILFADGCVDGTQEKAAKLLLGKNHLVVNANDTHEIKNYNLATVIGAAWGCTYVVLLQDDDVYREPVSEWLDLALQRLNDDPDLSIIGLNSGFHLTERNPVAADEEMSSALFEIVESDGHVYHRLAHYEEVVSSSVRSSPTGANYEYVAIVNRAPQIMRIKDAIDLGFFPSELTPFQYDDYFNCFKCWLSNKKVLFMPISSKVGNVGTGGMRLYNNVRINSRPKHFSENFNYVLKFFGEQWRSGKIQDAVAKANRSQGV